MTAGRRNPWRCRVCGADLSQPQPVAPSCGTDCPLRDPATLPRAPDWWAPDAGRGGEGAARRVDSLRASPLHSDAGADGPPRRVEETSHVQWPVSAADSGGRDPSGQDQPQAVADGPGERKFLRSGLARRVAFAHESGENNNAQGLKALGAVSVSRRHNADIGSGNPYVSLVACSVNGGEPWRLHSSYRSIA
jgi:hypothetical protein